MIDKATKYDTACMSLDELLKTSRSIKKSIMLDKKTT
jgi:hypothetical protein